jgi:hypothetical protein
MSVGSSDHLPGFALHASVPTLTRVAATGAALLVAVYCAVLVLTSPVPVQDLPSHLARAAAMSDLFFHGGARYGGLYQFHLLYVPYLLGDLILTVAVELFGTSGGAAFWTLLVFLSFPFAALYYVRVRGIEANDRVLMLLLSLYFATDWFFLMGFWTFRISVAMLIATLGLVELLRRRWSYACFALYVIAVVLDYLMHLSPVIFLFVALGATALLRLGLRTTTLRTEVALFVPVIVVLLWHFVVASHYREAGDTVTSTYLWGTWESKFQRIGSQFFHFAPRTDLLLVALLVCILLVRTGAPRWRDLRRPLVLEMLVLAITFLAMYFVLPLGYSEAYYVDTRPLPLVSFFFIAACLALPPRPDRGRARARERLAMALAALLALGNLAYLTRHFIADRAWIAQYRALATAIPLHGRVFTIYTHGGEGSFYPFLHTSGFVAIDRAATEPYVFAGNNGNPMKYFRYTHVPYIPAVQWYGEIPRPRIDWRRVAQDYDFLLITRPYDPRVLGVPTRPVSENSTATLLQILK